MNPVPRSDQGDRCASANVQPVPLGLCRYTSTIHAINSAVIKMSKLTKACKVYRGIAGLALPKQFWEPNEYNVKGGVENGFM